MGKIIATHIEKSLIIEVFSESNFREELGKSDIYSSENLLYLIDESENLTIKENNHEIAHYTKDEWGLMRIYDIKREEYRKI